MSVWGQAPVWFPLLTLLVGFAAGVIVTIYVQGGRP